MDKKKTKGRRIKRIGRETKGGRERGRGEIINERSLQTRDGEESKTGFRERREEERKSLLCMIPMLTLAERRRNS